VNDILAEITDVLDTAETKERKATKRAAKASKEKKKPESLEEAFNRVLATKLTEEERLIVLEVKRLLDTDKIERADTTKKLSKKEVFLLWEKHRLNRRELLKQRVIDTKPDNFWVVTNSMDLYKVSQMLATEDITAWDTETTGLDLFNDRVIGYSIYMPKHDIAVYIAWGHEVSDPQCAEAEALSVARWYLSITTNKTIWHNYAYDGHLFLNMGIAVANPYWDTCIVSKILNEKEDNHKLKSLYDKYVLKANDSSPQFSDLFDGATIYDKPVLLSGIYAAGDAYKTYKLYAFQKPFIDTVDNLKTVWYQIEQPLMEVDLAMERTGWRIDLDRIEKLKTEMKPHLLEAEETIKKTFNIDEAFLERMSSVLGRTETEFNVNSPQHLAFLIYDELGIDENFGKKFGKAVRTTAADVVEAICSDHEELTPLLEYRKLSKLLSTYLVKIPNAIEPATGRLHSRFNNMGSNEKGATAGTETGRYSSSTYVSGKNSKTGDDAKGTNLQNLPSKGIGVEVRKCFIPDEGWVFIGADLSQIEPRVIAHVLATQFGDRAMLEFYLAGKDLYTEMAMFTFGFPRENCVDKAYSPDGTFQPRKLLKQGTLSYLYGSSAKSFARSMKVSEEIAAEFFEKMIIAFPGLEAFRADVLRKLLNEGATAHATTLFGRKRRFLTYRKDYVELQRLNKMKPWNMKPSEKERRNKLWGLCASVERQALNHVIQGSAADILKQNMVRMYKYTSEKEFKFICSIHDELIISLPADSLTPKVVGDITEIMIDTVKLSTPLKADVVIMPERWMDEYGVNDWDFDLGCPKQGAA
jgi:DNA polymerase-1